MRELDVTPNYSADGSMITVVVSTSDGKPITYPELAMTLSAYAKSLFGDTLPDDLDS